MVQWDKENTTDPEADDAEARVDSEGDSIVSFQGGCDEEHLLFNRFKMFKFSMYRAYRESTVGMHFNFWTHTHVLSLYLSPFKYLTKLHFAGFLHSVMITCHN